MPAPPVQLDLAQVRRRLARAAAVPDACDKASVLQQEVARRMLERLEYVKLTPALVIDAGCGMGYALKGLAGRFPDARLLAVDSTPAMLVRARQAAGAGVVPAWMRRWLSSGPVQPVAADSDRLPLPDSSAGCIWSNLALHWWANPPTTFAEWHRVLDTGGLVLFSTLGPDTLKELRAAWGQAGGVRVHSFADMHDVGDALIHAGFADPVMDMETITLTYRDLDDLFSDLRRTGSTNSHAARSRGLAGKQAWREMRAAYEALRRDGTLPATFEIVYGHAWKPRPRPARDAVAMVRVEDIGRPGR